MTVPAPSPVHPSASTSVTLAEVDTPYALLDIATVDRNVARLKERLDRLGVPLRLHAKTAKSVDVLRHVFPDGPGPITASTLAEAEYFADAGYTDIVYAVGIDPHKLPRVAALRERGVDLTVLLDNTAQAEALAAFARTTGVHVPALVEIDADGHRAGIVREDPALLAIADALVVEPGTSLLRGVLTHAGESYFCTTYEAQRDAAHAERDAVVAAAERLRAAGHDCPVVSVGSTPTAHAAEDLTGVTEVRAGCYVFFDLVMAGIGVCALEDLALSVVVTVTGHNREKGWILTDGGWMAMSRDRGTAAQEVDQGYGVVLTMTGEVVPDLIMSGASQEHGILTLRPEAGGRDGAGSSDGAATSGGVPGETPEIPVGTRLRILPNHACATAGAHPRYYVVAGEKPGSALAAAGEDTPVHAVWERLNHW